MPPSRKVKCSSNIRTSKKRKINTEENTKRKRRHVQKRKQTARKARIQVKRKLKRSTKKQVRRKLKRSRKKRQVLVKRKKVSKPGKLKKPEIKEPEFQRNTKVIWKKTKKKEVQLQVAAVRKDTNPKTKLCKVGAAMRKLLREEKMKNELWVANCKLEVKNLEVWMSEVKEVIKEKINQESIKKSSVGKLSRGKTTCTRMILKSDKPHGENILNTRDECPSIHKKIDSISLVDHRGLNKRFKSSEISGDGARTKDAKFKIDDQLKIYLELEMVNIYSCFDKALEKLENEAKQLSILRKKKVLAEARCNRDASMVSVSSFDAENQEVVEISSELSVNDKLKDLICRLDVIKNLVHSENNALKEEIRAVSGDNSKVHKLRPEKEIACEKIRSLDKEHKLVTRKKTNLWDKVSKIFEKLQAVKYLRNMMGVTLEKDPKDEHSQEKTLGRECEAEWD